MKVLFVNTVYKQGSTGRIVADLGTLLESQGHEFMVAYGRGHNVEGSHCYRIGSNIDVCLHAALSRITDRTGFYSRRATRRLIDFIKEYSPDIIHLHNMHGYYVNVGILFSYLNKEFKGKIVWTLHDCWAFTGHCVHYSYKKCERWKQGCYKCPEKTRYPASYITDSSKSNYIKKRILFSGLSNLVIVTPSEWLKAQVTQSYLKDYKVIVINNGIDLNVFRPKENVARGKKIILNVTDGLDSRKGFFDLLDLRRLLPEAYLIRIVGVGKTSKYHMKGIEFVEHTDSVNELVNYYNSADYLVNPTYEDTFPTINLEALACGLPVITYRSGGSPEVVENQCGAVVHPGDVSAMASEILDKVGNSEKCIIAAKQYDINEKYMEYVELYYELLNGAH